MHITRIKGMASDTRISRAVAYPGTVRARCNLTSVVGREPVHFAWYDRWLTINPIAVFTKTSSSTYVRKFVPEKEKKKELRASDTRCSQAVAHPSTGSARCKLTSVIGREPVHFARYDRWLSTKLLRLKINASLSLNIRFILRQQFTHIKPHERRCLLLGIRFIHPKHPPRPRQLKRRCKSILMEKIGIPSPPLDIRFIQQRQPTRIKPHKRRDKNFSWQKIGISSPPLDIRFILRQQPRQLQRRSKNF